MMALRSLFIIISIACIVLAAPNRSSENLFTGYKCSGEGTELKLHTLSGINIADQCQYPEVNSRKTRNRTSCNARSIVDPNMDYFCCSNYSNANMTSYRDEEHIVCHCDFKEDDKNIYSYSNCFLYEHKLN